MNLNAYTWPVIHAGRSVGSDFIRTKSSLLLARVMILDDLCDGYDGGLRARTL